MYRAIQAIGGIVLVVALLSTGAHAQTSNNDLRQWLLDYTRWSTDMQRIGTSISSEYASQLGSSEEAVVFLASALDADTRLALLRASTTAEDLSRRYGPLVRSVPLTSANQNLVRAVNAAQRSVNSIRPSLIAISVGGISAREWNSAFRDFDVYSMLSSVWLEIDGLSHR